MSIWKFPKSTAVRGLILSPGKDAFCLIRREKRGHLYYVAPGGGLEKGEDPLQGLHREIKEETGLEVTDVERRGAIEFEGKLQIYYSAQAKTRFIQPQGEESSLLWQKDNGLFHPEWIPFSGLVDLPFVSPLVLRILREFADKGWPTNEFKDLEKSRSTRKLKVS